MEDQSSPAAALTPSKEREILWYAEEQGDSAAGKKFGLTRQRVTAMRNRYERKRGAAKAPEAPKRTPERAATSTAKKAESAVPPLRTQADVAEQFRTDHPRTTNSALTAARGTIARSAYTQGATSAAKATPVADVAHQTGPSTADAEEPIVTVGQILAARFGIKLPPTK